MTNDEINFEINFDGFVNKLLYILVDSNILRDLDYADKVWETMIEPLWFKHLRQDVFKLARNYPKISE